MSDQWIVLIPEDPHYMPDAEQRNAAVRQLQALAPVCDDIRAIVRDTVGFFDCAASFESVSCPECRASISPEWWNQSIWRDCIDEHSDQGFKLDQYETPCCATPVTLNDLLYDAPQGFARFALEVMNLRTESLARASLDERNVAALEEILKVRLRRIDRRL